jgi:hypothetical protein
VVVSQRRFVKAFPIDLTQGPEVAPLEVFGSAGGLSQVGVIVDYAGDFADD